MSLQGQQEAHSHREGLELPLFPSRFTTKLYGFHALEHLATSHQTGVPGSPPWDLGWNLLFVI